MNHDNKIFIYGVPGVGKTHIARKLAKESGRQLIEGDKLKSNFRKGKSKAKFPFLYLGTCKAYRQFGTLSKETAIQGLLSVREALSAAVISRIKEEDNLILEGAFLDPHSLIKQGRIILITVTDIARHRRQFLHHLEKLVDLSNSEFKAARIIQEYLIEEANDLGIEIRENS